MINKLMISATIFLLWYCLFMPNPANGQLATSGQTTADLYRGFVNPPEEAKPRTWWHWTGGNVTNEGITKDLEWMKRSGIGGFMAFDISFGAGQTVDKKTVFFTPEWFDALKHAASEADRLGLEMTLQSSAGWSETGGPWVKPEEAIKKLVWSEVQLTGSQKYSGILPQPPRVNGAIQNLERFSRSMFGAANPGPDPTFYADTRVVAFRTPAAEQNMKDLNPKVTTSGGDINASYLMDDNLATKISLPKPTAEASSWIQFEFEKPYTARAFSIALALTGNYGSSSMRPGYLKVSNDGKTFRTLATLPGAQHDIRALPVRTFAFPETSARFYRVEFIPGSGTTTVGGPDGGGFGVSTPTTTFDILEAKVISGARVNRWEDKANFAPMFEFETLTTPSVPSNAAIQPADMIDITSEMNADGRLTWDIPAGNWTIMRFGYSLTGSKNGPAVPEGTGLESDKLSKKHLESYYHGYIDKIKQALGPLFGKSLQYFLIDSYEADAQNWTNNIMDEFQKRRDYDMAPYLPVLTGRIVQSAEISDRFLWDYRRTIADLLADEHYGAFTNLAHNDGIKTYSEAAGISLPVIQDAMQNKGRMDIPMGEFTMTQGLGSETAQWMSPKDLDSDHAYRGAGDRMNAHQADIRETAAASHIYGNPFVASESWTGGGYEAPYSMKIIGDYWNTQGVNRFIFHTSAHQPLDTKPGNVMVGTHLNRNITWAELASPYFTYLARNSYMLQQGKFVADIIYYLGEGIPSAVPYWEKLKPEPPVGYDYDFMNTEILLESASVEDGMIVLKSGMKYRVMVLPDTDQMTPHVLNKIRELVAAGATIVGPKPVKSPSLSGYPEVDKEIDLLANEIWGDTDGKMVYKHVYGKGKVYRGVSLTAPLADLKMQKDLDYTMPHTNTYLSWIHRRTSDADLYFITNMRNQTENLNVSLRVSGKIPELWHPDSGLREAISFSIVNGVTTISLKLDPKESVFVVLQEPARNTVVQLPEIKSVKLSEITGAWEVAFQPNLGAPEAIRMEKLASWTENTDEGVKYYSGTATYSKQIQAPKSWFKSGQLLVLDLGEVKDIVEVLVNGKRAGILWKPPYAIDVTTLLKTGINKLEMRVTNEWNNRIAGDKKLPAEKKILSGSGFPMGRGGNGQEIPLEKSGLIGPVTISSEQVIK